MPGFLRSVRRPGNVDVRFRGRGGFANDRCSRCAVRRQRANGASRPWPRPGNPGADGNALSAGVRTESGRRKPFRGNSYVNKVETKPHRISVSLRRPAGKPARRAPSACFGTMQALSSGSASAAERGIQAACSGVGGLPAGFKCHVRPAAEMSVNRQVGLQRLFEHGRSFRASFLSGEAPAAGYRERDGHVAAFRVRSLHDR